MSHKSKSKMSKTELAAMLAAVTTGLVLVVIPEPASTVTGLGILAGTFGYIAEKKGK